MDRAAGSTWSSVRRLVFGGGPLMRGTDRVQRISRMVVLLTVLAAGVLAPALAVTTHAQLAAVASERARHRHEVRAFVLRDADAAITPERTSTASRHASTRSPASDDFTSLLVHARASWTAPGGSSEVGEILVRSDVRTGQTVTIWVDDDGTPTTAPPRPADVTRDAVGAGIGTFLAISLTAWALHGALCAVLDRRRRRQWSSEWATVEPIWRGQLL